MVFDNPKTVVIGREKGRPLWNQTLAQVAIDYGFTIELCTPRSPEQKGSVENLIGWVKRAFFRVDALPIWSTTSLVSSWSGWSRAMRSARPAPPR